ncbi:MAG: hypothetical protein RL211_685 [Pseudomonadota bacterium]|jgi:hypothetical protein
MNQTLILYPMATMLLLLAVVACIMFRARIAEMNSRRIHPQKVATRAKSGTALENTCAADNYQNLCEMPVMFHVLGLALFVTHGLTTPLLALAWVYVALRVAHSYIHITYNKVMHRFYVFAASSVLLWVMWLVFVVQLLGRA